MKWCTNGARMVFSNKLSGSRKVHGGFMVCSQLVEVMCICGAVRGAEMVHERYRNGEGVATP